ncbi:LysR family transcriptional regulator [Bradyrhizobium sp.]|uniref:LysR family transcriptional regulator n=1 Tax=Bradyrhizobium sp. TaxID=376 RepID=UPI001DFF98D0|nr:LysR family transcriptional regulator [Bradyrhizobium sp.]MBI5318102.1 LysR family transcriptional regulator [Bradyrhizobium sp.]
MEMHQIRYFLAVSRTLNFTRAADECNVAQPSLTRAIKQLEAELGGDLFRRERPAAQLTELGQRMHPLLKQCYEAAVGARSLATSFKGGKIGTLRIAIADAVDIALLIPHLNQLKRMFNALEFRLLRGNSKEIGEYLKKGDAELGIAVEIDRDWDRLDSWPLFTESFQLVVNRCHPLADSGPVDVEALRQQPSLSRGYCEYAERVSAALRAGDVDSGGSHEVSCEHDLIKLLEADIGMAIMPRSASTPDTLRRAEVEGLDIKRTVQLYGVAGRERTAVASAVMKMLRSADWQAFTQPAAPPNDAKPPLSIIAA